MKSILAKIVGLFSSRHDVPPDSTWSKQSVAAQKVVQEEALVDVAEDSAQLIETKGHRVSRAFRADSAT